MDSAQKQHAIVNVLSQGGFHSGEALGQQLGISRAAVSRQIQQLNKLGLDIYSVTGKGYSLANPLGLLSVDEINQYRSRDTGIMLRHVTASTNDEIKSRLEELNKGDFCIAEAQTAGRGRQGRRWVSPFGASLYYSMYWAFGGGFQAISGLSLLVGLVVADTLDELGHSGVQLKWPNDIFVGGRKLGGVLIEVDGQIDGHCQTVIGIGLNVSLPSDNVDIDQPWVDLAELSSVPIDRNQLVACLTDNLCDQLEVFEREGLQSFVPAWTKRDCFRDREVSVNSGKSRIRGIARGIDENGGLKVEIDGRIRVFYGGEISVRAS